MIVIDASALIEWLFQTSTGVQIERRAISAGDICAPHLLDLEVLQTLRKLVRSQTISVARAMQALEDFRDMDIARYAHNAFLPRIWSLRDTCTAYDAVYVALAESLSAVLVTHDRKLASAHPHAASIEMI